MNWWGIVFVMPLLLAGCVSVGKHHASPLPTDAKILFLGNSYTDGIQRTFKQVATNAGYENAHFMFVWGGGATLEKLIDNGRAAKWIEKEDWDLVVLQEQSLRPALSEHDRQAFDLAVDTLAKKVRSIGAEPLLYMTWGRRDGSSRFEEVYPDYATMQRKISAAYRDVGKKHELRVAAVGEAWSVVRRKDAKLGEGLYRDDGSHPSTKGAYLASCVFLKILFDDPLTSVGVPEGMTESECRTIRDAGLRSYQMAGDRDDQ